MPTKEEILNELDMSDLSPDMQFLAECVGLDITKELISKVGGMRFNIPMPSSLPGALERWICRNGKFLDNNTLKRTAMNFGVCENTIKKIYFKARIKIVEHKQGKLFNEN